MQKRNLLSESEIYFSILNEKTEYFNENVSEDKISFKDVVFPSIQQFDLQIIRKEMERSTDPIKILRKYKISFHLDTELLETIYQKPITAFNSSKQLIDVVLFSYLGWCIQNTENKDPPVILFSTLAFICDPSVLKGYDELKFIAISAFYHLFTKTFGNRDRNFGEYLSPLFLLLSQNRDLPEKCYNMMLLASHGGHNAESPSEIPTEFKDVLLFATYLELPSNTAEDLIQEIIYQVSLLNFNALMILKGLLPMVKEPENLSHILEVIVINLINYANDNVKNLNTIKSEKSITQIDNYQSSEGILSFFEHDPFPHGLNLETILDLSDTVSFRSILGEDVCSTIDLIYSVFEKTPLLIQSFISNFITCIKISREQERLLVLYSAFYKFCLNIEDFSQYSQYSSFILNDVVFTPKITYFNKEEGWNEINTIRNVAIKLALQLKGDVFNEFFTKNRFYPNLFGETIHRLISFSDGRHIESIIPNSLIKAALFYRPLTTKTDEVEFALTSIFLLIYIFFQQQSIQVACFSNLYFSQSFIAFLFEPKVRSFVLREIRDYIILDKTYDKNPPIVQQLTSVICIACTNLNDKSIQLISDTLFAINEVLVHKWNFTKPFECLLPTFFNACTNLTKTPIITVFIDNLLSFIALISTNHTLTGPEINAMEMIIKSVYNKDSPITIFYKLIQIATSSTLASQSTSIKIQQPRVLRTIISIFEESPHFSEVIQFIGGFCNFSYKNCVVCHNAEIDNLLIGLLKNGHNDKLAPVIFDTFNRISTVISSVSVMQRYISLFCPEDGKITSIHVNALKAISQNMYISRRMPPVSMPFSNDSVITIKNLNSEVIAEGFAFCIWVFHEPNGAQYKPRILYLSESPNKFISVSCSTSRLVVCHQADEYDTLATVDIQIPSSQWALIALEYGNDERSGGTCLYASVNCSDAKRISLPAFTWKKKQVICKIGGLEQDSIKPNYASRFSQFQLLKSFTEQHLIATYEAGPRADPMYIENIIIAGNTILKRNELSVKKVHAQFGTSISYTYGNKETMVSLSEVLGHMCKVELLLPLFSFVDMPLVGCESSTNYPNLVISVFSNTLSMSEYAQQLFYESEGFSIISHLLLKCSPKHITYKLYLHFISMLETITFPELQMQLLDKIILNNIVLHRADAVNHMKIIRHWVRVVYPSYTAVFEVLRPIKHLLGTMKSFYEPKDNNRHFINIINTMQPNLNYSECRKLIMTIIQQMASIKFTEEDFNYLLGSIITESNHELAIDYLDLLGSLITMNPSPLSDISVDSLTLLTLIFSFKDEYIITQVFRIFFVANQKKMFKTIPLSEHIFVILSQLTYDIVKEPVFTSLSSLFVNGFYELLPIIIWIAINLGRKSMATVADLLTPKKEYVTNNFWYFWPMILLFKVTSFESMNKIMKFLIFTDKEYWETIFATFDLVGEFLEENTEEAKSVFLSMIADDLIQTKCNNIDKIQSFFTMARASILYNNTNQALNTLMNFSPYHLRSRVRALTTCEPSLNHERNLFIDDFNFAATSSNKSSLNLWMTPSVVSAHITNMNKRPETKTRFSLRLGPDGEWLDSELAKKCLNLFVILDSVEFLEFDMILCVFLIPYYYADVKNHFINLKLNSTKAAKLTPYLALINIKCEENSYPMIFKLPVKECHTLAFSALEEMGNMQPPSCLHGTTIALNQITRFLSSISEKSNAIFAIQNTTDIYHAQQQFNKLVYTIQRKRRDDEKKWHRLWRCLSFDGAPWSVLCSIDTNLIPMKRDSVLCNDFCPSRLKRDWRQISQPSVFREMESPSYVLSDPKKKKITIKRNSCSAELKDIPCTLVKIQKSLSARLIINPSSFIIRINDSSIREYSYDSVTYILPRFKINGQNGIEIFFKEGQSKLLTFEFPISRSVFPINKMHNLITPNITSVTKKWVNGEISNFSYIIFLNMISGRTFNNIDNYPVTPWIIEDYNTSAFNVKDHMFIRDLMKPISQQGEERLMRIIEKNQKEGDMSNFALPGSILRPEDIKSMLCRLLPFSSIAGDVKPALSVKELYEKATTDDNCFSELPPEFYFFPEVFIKTRPESDIPDMIMPDWANNDPYAYVYYNRKALESKIVSSSLNQWIDLVWGVRQNGPDAAASFTQFGEDAYVTSKSEKREGGFMPLQLFNEPHPQRNNFAKKTSGFKSPITIQTCQDDIVYSSFYRSDNHINVLLLDSTGIVSIYKLNFEQICHRSKDRKNGRRDRNFSSVSKDMSSRMLLNNLMNTSFMNIPPQNGLGEIRKSESFLFNSKDDSTSSSFELDNSSAFAIPSSISMTSMQQYQKSQLVSSFSFEQLQNSNNPEFYSGQSSRQYSHTPHTTMVIPKFNKIDLTHKAGQFSLISNDTLGIVDSGLIKLFRITQRDISTLESHLSDVTTIFSNDVWTATTSKCSVLTLYHTNNLTKYVFSIPLYRDTIQCTYISTNFNIAVSGTRDGFLFIISLTRGTADATIDLKGARPYKIMITPSWGFIVVYMTELERGIVHHVLALYSPNGKLIKRRTIANGIAAWSSFSTPDCSDYIVCADEKGKLWLFEAFTLYLDENFFRSNSQIINIIESVDEGGAIAIGKDGRIFFIPNSV